MDRMADEQVLLMFRRLFLSQDGKDFMLYLAMLSEDNYNSFKNSDSTMNDIHKGYALCIDNIIRLFENCNKEVPKQKDFAID